VSGRGGPVGQTGVSATIGTRRARFLGRARAPRRRAGRPWAHPHVCLHTSTSFVAQVAIKRVSRVFQDLIDAKRILREIKLLRHLGHHENVIELLDLMTCPPDAEDFHTLYIVTSLFECDLERIISSSQRLTDQHAQYFVYQILRGLKFIHSAHVLHR
jgi:serine/threonine protein kinase